jgi:hypothetical protein
MPPTDEDKREGIITVPPPEGEDDPYGAPTRVARVPDKLLNELMNARADATRAETTGADAAANDLSALAAAASHVVVPPRPKAAPAKPPLPASAKTPLAAHPAPAPPVAPPQLVDASMPTRLIPVQGIPVSIDEAELEEVSSEAPSSHATAPLPPPMQSGRTVPLSAALLADVLKSVDDRRAAATRAEAPVAGPVEAPVRKRRSVVALVLVLAVGLAVFITGVVMFLKALG